MAGLNMKYLHVIRHCCIPFQIDDIIIFATRHQHGIELNFNK